MPLPTVRLLTLCATPLLCALRLRTPADCASTLTVRQAFKRNDVILSNGGEVYCGLDSITERNCGHFLEVRDVFRFSGPANGGQGGGVDGGSDGGGLPSLILQPAAMHVSASRKPTVMPNLGSLDPSGLTVSRPRPYQVEVGATQGKGLELGDVGSVCQ